MKQILTAVLAISTLLLRSQTCTAMYSYGANFTNVHFFNQSISANAHYYWNFGDGIGSNLKDPIHDYVENGTYLVTLYSNDTVSNCSAFYEQWLSITKNSNDPCSPVISDSIYNVSGSNYLKILDYSINCAAYNPVYTVGSASGPYNDTKGIGQYNGNFIAIGYYFINNALKRSATKTAPNNYDRSKNYRSCSANFEILPVSEDNNGQRILFRAMNHTAASYLWLITDFGPPIYSSNDTISIYYPDIPNSQFPNTAHDVILRVAENNGCRDSLWQQVIINSEKSTYVGIKTNSPENNALEIYPNPVKDKLLFHFKGSRKNVDQVILMNALGETVFILNKPGKMDELDVSSFRTGIYYLKILDTSSTNFFKVIKE